MWNFKWWICRMIMRLRGDKGCKGEGYTKDSQGLAIPCLKSGCH